MHCSTVHAPCLYVSSLAPVFTEWYSANVVLFPFGIALHVCVIGYKHLGARDFCFASCRLLRYFFIYLFTYLLLLTLFFIFYSALPLSSHPFKSKWLLVFFSVTLFISAFSFLLFFLEGGKDIHLSFFFCISLFMLVRHDMLKAKGDTNFRTSLLTTRMTILLNLARLDAQILFFSAASRFPD